ncbi:MAG TPA: hypothetical protein ENK44_08470 [Caldithrix abyssi]|uniref:Porin n=1 Tax=Caldithrix abyssi TaxID=187145 RepID=A0A7V4U0E1_CALAY|nr:hypothetical protein [Caldithrix abyssi]
MRNIFLIIAVMAGLIYAQDKPGESRFLLRGYAHSGLEMREDASTFVGGSFNPIFLWRQSQKLLFEAELEIEVEGGETNIGLEYANMAYILHSYAILRLGKFLLPFGAFAEKLHPAWINRMPTKPLGFGHDGVGPARGLGVELRGGIPVGVAKMSYSVYVINGPVLNDGSDPTLEPEEAGKVNYEPTGELESENKAIGGRVSLLPFSNSSMEIGLSGFYSNVGQKGTEYEDVTLFAYALDFSFVKKVSFLSGVIDIKAQYNAENVSDAYYTNYEDSSRYTFKNNSSSYYGQLSYRPVNLGSDFFNSLEIVGRYSALSFPKGALWEADQTQVAVGINYWIDWRNVIKLTYQVTDAGAHGEESGEGQESRDAVFIHWAFGF